ncbi:hypothetical protein [Sinisalibacter aestuarii]|nr:hypothetical protein [Sinisalibacter aestuarii]
MTDKPRGPAAIRNHPALDGTPLPKDVVQRHIWMLDVLRQLHLYATQEGLPAVAENIVAASDALLNELRGHFHGSDPEGGAAGA